MAKLDGVEAASGSLTLRANHISGTVPDIDITQGQGGGPGAAPPAQGSFGDSSIEFDSRTVTGVDQSQPDIAPVTPSQITKGAYFSSTGAPRQAIVSSAYAGTKNLAVGDSIDLGGKTFRIIGVASSPIGGSASDVYVKLATLQKVADYAKQVSAVQVRATSAGDVDAVAAAIEKAFPNSQVTTASDLAARVGGSLKDTRDLSSTLGAVLAIVGLVAAILIASLLTLSSVAKRTRELGHAQGARLVALGGRAPDQRRVADPGHPRRRRRDRGRADRDPRHQRQRAGRLDASVAGPSTRPPAPVRAHPGARPAAAASASAQAAVTAGNGGREDHHLALVPDPAAIGLAALGGLIAGAVGSLRAARLRPAAALRTVE